MSRVRRTVLVVLGPVVALGGFAVPAAGAPAPRAPVSVLPPGTLNADPGFAEEPGPWRSAQGTVDRVEARGTAPEGDTAGELVAGLVGARNAVVVESAVPAVRSTVPGRSYAAAAWIRGPDPAAPFLPRREARLVVREREDGRLVAVRASAPVTLDRGAYRRVSVSLVPTAPGHRLDVRVELRGGVGFGERFRLDAVSLVQPRIASVHGSATTVRSDRPLPPGGAERATVAAAGNETASFQVAIRAPGVPLTGVRLGVAGDLRGPGGSTIPSQAVALARERDYRVVVPTDGEGGAGLWPDALVPDRDPLLGGDGGAFPVDLPARGGVTVWVDVAVPRDQPPGRYTGSLSVAAAGTPTEDVPIELTVHAFSLPSSSSLRSLFLLNPYAVCRASPDGNAGGYESLRRPDGQGCDAQDEATWKLFARTAQLGLRDRISIANPFPTPRLVAPSTTDPVRADPPRPGAPRNGAEAFSAYVAPLLDGTSRQGSLDGARLTTLTTQWECIQELGAGCTAGWRALLDARAPAARRLFLPWVCDEPMYDDVGHHTPWRDDDRDPESCQTSRRLAREGWPGVPVKITTPIDDEGLYADGDVEPSRLGREAVDVIAPNTTDLVTREGGSTRPRYDERPTGTPSAPWLYLSCTSGGCDPDRDPDDPILRDPGYDGWPSYSIDQPGSQASAMGWMAFLYRASGESYFDVAAGFSEGPAFQHGIDVYGTNGDGQLFYPGFTTVRGPAGPVREPLPLESIRLKRIREGREDYEYLHRLERCGRRSQAESVVRDLFGDPDRAMFSTTVGQARLDGARTRLAELVERGGC